MAGITVMPVTGGPGDEVLRALCRLPPPAPTRRVVLACRKQFYRHNAIAALCQAVRHSSAPGVQWLDNAPMSAEAS